MKRKAEDKVNVQKNKNARWIWMIVVGAILFVVNIVLSCIFSGSNGSNIFTAISGWVSGIATIALGVIAVVQNRKYKQENDRYLMEQEKLNRLNIKEQQDLEWRKSKYELLMMSLTGLQNRFHSFEQYCDIKTITTPICLGLIENEALIISFGYSIRKFRDVMAQMITYIKYSPLYFEWHDEIYENLYNYVHKILPLFENLSDTLICKSGTVETVSKMLDSINDYSQLYDTISSQLSTYILMLESCIADIFTKDVEYLKKYYDNLELGKQRWLTALSERGD